MGIIDKSGSWYSYKDERIGQGRENAKMFLVQNINVMNEIEEKVKSMLNMDTGKKEKKDIVKEKK